MPHFAADRASWADIPAISPDVPHHFCLFFGVISGQGDPLRWAAVHRHHHLHSDTEEDPHGPHKGWISYFLSDAYGDINLILKDRRVKSKLNLFLFLRLNDLI